MYTTKNRDLLYPHKKCLCVPMTNPPLSLKFAFLSSLKTSRSSGCNPWGRLGKTESNFSDYDISQPTPSVSLSVPSCSLDIDMSNLWGNFQVSLLSKGV